VDFQFEDMGTVVMVTPVSDEAEELMHEMDLEPWQMWGKSFVVDHRVARDMIEWMKFNDLNLEIA
jgi:hypothetical protein